jgi:hypothetical protein
VRRAASCEVVAVIEEQQQWIRERFPGITPRHLFMQRTGNRQGDKPYPSGTYNWMLREFSKMLKITDGKGKPVGLSHTHRFRHTKLTRLVELGLPVHVLMRYAGHATPSMSIHYVAARQEHAEQAFLATAKLRADGTHVTFSHDDHDSLHLCNRAHRFLPHGWCMLPPLQTCDKGNACLTCSVFVIDASHQSALEGQLAETTALIHRSTTAFQQRHGRPMPEDNVWLGRRGRRPARYRSCSVRSGTGRLPRLRRHRPSSGTGERQSNRQVRISLARRPVRICSRIMRMACGSSKPRALICCPSQRAMPICSSRPSPSRGRAAGICASAWSST